tara:strand:+ start:82654 stop:83124 length:471 start_codon:yes stop_codon:yes gene_type:complete
MKIAKYVFIGVIAVVIIIGGLGISKGIIPIGLGIHDQVTQSQNDVAINGYDPVNYFSNQKAEEGLNEYTTSWNGANWHFLSEANKNAFIENPAQYAPQFGGYCAFAVSTGFTAPGDPNVWIIDENENLIFFSNQEVKEETLKNKTEILDKAKAAWE